VAKFWGTTSKHEREYPRTASRKSAGGRPRRRSLQNLEALESRRLLTTIPVVTVFPTSIANSNTQRIVRGFDGNMWFTDPGANAVGFINPTTHAVEEFPLPTPNAQPWGIAKSHDDGHIWFTERNANAVATIDPNTHVITEFHTPIPNGGPTEIAEGPVDGVLYITETDAGHLSDFSPVTHAWGDIALPNSQSSPDGINFTSDATVFFTEAGDPGNIGVVDPIQFTTHDFATPTANSHPGGISTQDSGLLWFTEGATNKIGAIDPATHAITEIALPANANDPNGLRGASRITVGPPFKLFDNTLYFTEALSHDVGTLDPITHALGFIAVPNAAPGDITVGANNTLWFTAGSSIGVIEFVQQSVATTSTTVSAAPNPSTVGQSVTFTAVVTPSTLGGTPTGTVTFSIDGATQPAVPVAAVNGLIEASITSSTLSVGNHAVTAVYGGDVNFSGSSGNTITQVVNAVAPVASSLEITAAATTVTVDSLDTFTITASGNSGPVTGSVTLTLDGRQPTVVPLTGGKAQLQSFGLTAGTHTIAATFGGSATYSPSQASIDVNVIPSDTVTVLRSFSTTATAGQPVAFTFRVAPVPSTVPVPDLVNPADTPVLSSDGTGRLPTLTGRFILSNGTIVVGTVTVAADGSGSFTASSLSVGNNVLTAAYSGDSNYNPSASKAVAVAVSAQAPPPDGPVLVSPQSVPTDGPGVVSVARFGFHAMPTALRVQFTDALDATSAQNVANYTIIGPKGRPVAVRAAVYDAATNMVMLSPAARLNLHKTYDLIVRGTGSSPIRNSVGAALDGASGGKSGSDYATRVTAANLVIVGKHPGAAKALALAAKAKRVLALGRGK
jgi:streptogramin lyase